jgi:hypothetical protein
MPQQFNLTLDTQAPAVAWGSEAGTTAGELLQLGYTSDEPIFRAELWLSDGRHLEITVNPATLEVLLPPDTPDGMATVHFWDDVDNEGTHGVLLSGTIAEAQASGFQRTTPRPRPGRKRIVGATVVRVGTEWSVSTRRDGRSLVAATGGIEIRAGVACRSDVAPVGHGHVTARVAGDSTRRLGEESFSTRRRDDPAFVELLLLL